MNVYIKHRFLLLLPVLLGITFFTFVLMQLPADDTVDMMYKASGAVSETVKAAARAELGLDRPLLVRYLDWLLAVCSGDMGRSYISGTPVTALFVTKLKPTLYLTALALLLTACISVPLGIAAALRHNRCCDHLIRCCAFLGNSLPGFFIALLLLYCFALKLNFFTVLGGSGFGGLLLPMSNLVDSVRAKQKVRVSVRPEEFVIVGADQPGIDATVEYSTFLGLNTHYVIRLKSGERVEIIQESQIDDIIENGTKIRLGVKAEKINVFNEDGTKSLIV